MTTTIQSSQNITYQVSTYLISTGPTHKLGKGLYRTCTPGAGILADVLEICLPQLGKKGNLGYVGSLLKLVQFSSVAQSCPTLCDPVNSSTPGLPTHHQLPEFTQTLIHRVSDAIQPSHPLSSPSPPAPNPSQHQSLFQ